MDTKTNSKIEEEKNSEIADAMNCSYVAGQISKRYKSEMLKPTNIESLPDETIFDIFLRVPSQDICNAAKFVCRKWYRTIHSHEFVHAHLLRSTPGLLIQRMAFKSDLPIFVAARKGQIEKSNINYKFAHDVFSSCNGLILERCDENSNDLRITNPVTKQHFSLPPFVLTSPGKKLHHFIPLFVLTNPVKNHFIPQVVHTTKSYSCTIAYAAASKEYKMVRPSYDESESRFYIAILTVGVDNDWTRLVNIEHLSQAPRFGIRVLEEKPLCTEGFVHWAERSSLRVMGEPEYVLTLNIETEIVTQFPVPSLCHFGERSWYYYLSTGLHLTLLISRTNFFWEVWEMESETGEWTNVMIVDLETEMLKVEWVCRLVPVGWLNFGEVLVFSVCARMDNKTPITDMFCIAYNVRSREIIDTFCTSGCNAFTDHRDSLVWLNLGGH